MEHQLTNYSPNIIIYLKIDDKIIRLSDVLHQTATLYSEDFEDIAPGTMADLVFSIDKKDNSIELLSTECYLKNRKMNKENLDRILYIGKSKIIENNFPDSCIYATH